MSRTAAVSFAGVGAPKSAAYILTRDRARDAREVFRLDAQALATLEAHFKRSLWRFTTTPGAPFKCAAATSPTR
jgi:hypothetical protein